MDSDYLEKKKKHKIIRGFTITRVLEFICELCLSGISIYLIFGGIAPFITKFGDKPFVELSISIILCSISRSLLNRTKKNQKREFGYLVYPIFERALITKDIFYYEILKGVVKILLIVGFSFGIIAYKLNLQYPLI